MKKCTNCGTTEGLYTHMRHGKRIYYNICKTCRSNKLSKSLKVALNTPEAKKNRWGNDDFRKRVGEKISESRKKYLQNPNNREQLSINLKKGWDKISLEDKKQRYKKISKILTGRSLSEQDKENKRKAAFKYISLKCSGGQCPVPRIGNNETSILNKIEYSLNITLQRQYQVCGYFIDGYDKENNTVYEVNESYHYTKRQIQKDELRKNNIINHLQCKWVDLRDNISSE